MPRAANSTLPRTARWSFPANASKSSLPGTNDPRLVQPDLTRLPDRHRCSAGHVLQATRSRTAKATFVPLTSIPENASRSSINLGRATIGALRRGARKAIANQGIVWSIKPLVRLRKESHPGVNIWRESMKTTLARHTAALIVCAGLGLAAPALAQDKTIKIGVLNDMSSLYADIGGANSVVAIKMAVEDSGLAAKGWKIEVLSGDHQNKPDVGVNIARQWLDNDKVDAIADTPNSGVALAVSNPVPQEKAVLLNPGAATADLTGKACTPNTVSFAYDTYMLANGTGKALTKAGGDTWFFLTSDYAYGNDVFHDPITMITANGDKVLVGV